MWSLEKSWKVSKIGLAMPWATRPAPPALSYPHAMIQHQCLLPLDWVEVLPHVLHYSQLLTGIMVWTRAMRKQGERSNFSPTLDLQWHISSSIYSHFLIFTLITTGAFGQSIIPFKVGIRKLHHSFPIYVVGADIISFCTSSWRYL